jgi:hypothetical protein
VFVALVTQHAMRMRSTVLSSLDLLVVPYISTLCNKRYDFWEKVVERKKCVLTFSVTVSETFLVLRTIRRDIVINLHRSKCKIAIILVRF